MKVRVWHVPGNDKHQAFQVRWVGDDPEEGLLQYRFVVTVDLVKGVAWSQWEEIPPETVRPIP